MMKDTNTTETKTGKALLLDMHKTITESLVRLEKEIAQLEGALSVPVLEDSHALILTDSNREGEVRVYGSWKDNGTEVRGFKHISIIPWHICGTLGYSQGAARMNVKRLQGAEQTAGVTYSYMHFRQLREMVLLRLKGSREIALDLLVKMDEKLAA